MQYCLYLSRKLKMTLNQLFDNLSEGELELQMAYDKFLSPSFQKQLEEEQQQREFDNLPAEEKRKMLDRLFRKASKRK